MVRKIRGNVKNNLESEKNKLESYQKKKITITP